MATDQPAISQRNAQDERLMHACLRMARRHMGLTATNPSVGTLLVHHMPAGPVIVGRGVTAIGGRPHAERVAIEQAGDRAKSATAYVTLEPCAHHGATPPCAEALIEAGVARVVTAWIDPDQRVDGKGHRMLMDAGITVDTRLGADRAKVDLQAYLTRKNKARPAVTLKLAVSQNGQLGRRGEEVSVTGQLARRMVHRTRAVHDAILVGAETVRCDDPELTVRLPGLEGRSPHRFILSTTGHIAPDTKLAQTAKTVPVSVITARQTLPHDLADLGVTRFAAEAHEGGLALPELLEDMASAGLSSLMVEGGAKVAEAFLDGDFVDRIELYTAPHDLNGVGLIASPVTLATVPASFTSWRTLHLGADRLDVFLRS
ncbi:MAG: bifunctional diaminohydroxyphosphoribosylaminopyrimidine deaminase/5-amino-6-(5-phosphoribosylamino)uracil reductase RibD [Pseudomonadota bacterium]